MIRPDQLRRGLTTIPGFVDEYGATGGLKRWFGIVANRAVRDISGRSIFSEEWDICIILDACRADELERAAGNYDWVSQVGRFPSLASCTWNWIPRTVEATSSEILRDTTYVSANPFAGELTEPDTFGELDRVYEYAWDDDHGTVYPRPVTDRAIQQWRHGAPERMVVHYVQPHVPFLGPDARSLGQTNFTHDEHSLPDAWDRVTSGQLPRGVAIDRYRETLQRVLADVDLLLSNVDAEDVVVTADHGEAFGEWGLYGHPQGIDIPCLTEVPWVTTTARDTGTHEPREYDRQQEGPTTSDQLAALGYVD